jgi:methionine aminopeptidase
VNDVVCHGIPDPQRVLCEGDIVNVDVTPILDGFHGDASRTFLIGEVSPIARKLVQDTYRSLWRGISMVRPVPRPATSATRSRASSSRAAIRWCRQFSGHGIGRLFHTAPAILHYGKPGAGERLVTGMTFTIEPMINLGDWRCQVLRDGWTAGDGRRLALRSVRAHAARDRDRRRGAHPRQPRTAPDRAAPERGARARSTAPRRRPAVAVATLGHQTKPRITRISRMEITPSVKSV